MAERREKARQKHSEMLSAQKNEDTQSAVITNEANSAVQNTTVSQQDTAQIDSTSELSNEETNPSEAQDQFIAFARVYSGVVKKGQKLFVLGPKHEPSAEDCLNDTKEEDVYEQADSE